MHGEYNILTYSFVETLRKFIIAKLSIRKLFISANDKGPRCYGSKVELILTLMKVQAYGSKACYNEFTWCFQKAKLVRTTKLCKKTTNALLMFLHQLSFSILKSCNIVLAGTLPTDFILSIRSQVLHDLRKVTVIVKQLNKI